MSGVEFGDLPGGQTFIRENWYRIAEELRQRPSEWAKVSTRNTQSAAGNLSAKIRTGQYIAFRPGGAFEATSRGAEVWARFVGESL